MKHIFNALALAFTALMVIGLTGCRGNGGNSRTAHDDADSIYTWNYIKRIHLADPDRSLALTETAEQKGIMSADSCNWIRSLIYYGTKDDYRKAETHCRQVLSHLRNDSTGEFYMKNVDLLASILISDRRYNDCLNTCLRGVALAHQAGNAEQEADFNSQAGICMEHITPGSGIRYLD